MNDDDALVSRLAQARQADRETLLSLEPRYQDHDFIQRLLDRIAGEIELLPLAHEVLQFAAASDPTVMAAYANITSLEAERRQNAGEIDEALEVLLHLEQRAYRHDNKEAVLSAKANRIISLLRAGANEALIVQAADNLVAFLADMDHSSLPRETLEMISGILADAASRAYYQEAEDIAAAVRLAEAAHRVTPNSFALHIAATGLSRRDEVPRARELYRELAKAEPTHAATRLHLAQCELRLGNTEAAIEALRLACELGSSEGKVLLSAAQIFVGLKRLADAYAMFQRAVPLCEQIARDNPELTLGMPSSGRLPLEDVVELIRYDIALLAAEQGEHSIAAREIDALVATGDEGFIAVASHVRSRLALRDGMPDEAHMQLDEAVARAPVTASRLVRADFHITRGAFDDALDDLGYIVRHTQEVREAVPRLEHILAASPEYLPAIKWLGCALTFFDGHDIDRGVSLLDRVLEADPLDGYARCIRGVARVRSRTDREAMFSSNDLCEAWMDVSVAAGIAPDDAEIQYMLRWLFDRMSADPEWLDWLVAKEAEPGGLSLVMPAAGQAATEYSQGMHLLGESRYREGISLLESAQRRLFAEGLPAFATRIHINIADAQLRLYEVQAALDHLERFDQTYHEIISRPLKYGVVEEAARIAAEHSAGLVKTVALEIEHFHCSRIGLPEVLMERHVLMAAAQARAGNFEAALASAAVIEGVILATSAPGAREVAAAVNLIPVLRDAGESARARALLEHARPHAADGAAVRLELMLATLLTQAGDMTAARAVYEETLARKEELPPEARKIASLNLALLLIHEHAPAEALALIEPHLDDVSNSPHLAIQVDVLAANAAYQLGKLARARSLTLRAFERIVAMRSQMSRHDDRVAMFGMYERFANETLHILVYAGEAETVLATVETMRARTLAEHHENRAVLSDDRIKAAEMHVEQRRRVDDALRRLLRGVERLGADYADAEALAVIRREDPSLWLFDGHTNTARLSVKNLTEMIKRSELALERARAEVEQHRSARARLNASPLESGSAEIRDALQKALAPGERCVVVSIIATLAEIALVFVDSDNEGARIRGTGISSVALRGLGSSLSLAERMERDADVLAILQAVIGPILEETRPGDIVVLGIAGFCAHVPFHAIPVNGEPWCARNPICYTPSATSLVRSIALPTPEGSAVVVGDPLGDLPKARDEARAVGALLGVEPLLGGEATIEAVRERLSGSRTSHVHVSCHGVADREEGMRSALLLAPADTIDDGRLTAEALVDADLAGARVVVSACDTGISEERTGAESFGLPRALLAAGARSIMASLWRVHDSATYFLMCEFYRRLRSEAAARALAGAQVWLKTRTAADIVALCDELLEAEARPDIRARFLLDRAEAETLAGDIDAARRTYMCIVRESNSDAAPVEVARATHALDRLEWGGDLPSSINYGRTPFSGITDWAPLVLIGDWR